METLIDLVRCDKPGIIGIEISGIGSTKQNNWRENPLLNSSSENLSYFATRL